jgi:hypothetical protein
VLLRRGISNGEPSACLACELGLLRKQLHSLRQRIQADLNDSALTDAMTGTAFEADELHQILGYPEYKQHPGMEEYQT